MKSKPGKHHPPSSLWCIKCLPLLNKTAAMSLLWGSGSGSSSRHMSDSGVDFLRAEVPSKGTVGVTAVLAGDALEGMGGHEGFTGEHTGKTM